MKGLKNIIKALRLIVSLDKYLFPLSALNVVCKSAAPYIDILLGAWILDALISGKTLSQMLPVIFGALGLRLVLRTVSELAEQAQWERDSLVHDLFLAKRSEKNLAMDYEKLDSPSVNALRDRMYQDDMNGWGISMVYVHVMFAFENIISMAMSLAIVAPLLHVGAAGAVYLFLTAAFIAAASVISGKFVKKEQEIVDSYEQARSHSAYYLWGNGVDYKMGKDIRVFGAQNLIEKAIAEDGAERDGRRRYVRFSDKDGAFSGFITGALQGSSYIYVVFSAVRGALSAGEVMKLATALYSFWSNLKTLFTAAARLAQTANRIDDTLEYLALPENEGGSEEAVRNGDLRFEFKNVSFTYPSGKEALKNVSCEIRRGERLAIVGLNGSGKTTFIKLLCRLYHPTEGEILLNGVNIEKYSFEEYAALISVVFQDFGLFPMTLGENVAAGENYDGERVKNALETAGFGDRLKTLKDALDTPLYKNYDDGGIDVSGGEAQKIALARALYKDAPFMVLDEPTAALDPIAEFEIYSRFNSFTQDKGAIYISHRLSSCVFCDRILVFENGRIVQRGSHSELLKSGGLYEKLWTSQAQYYKRSALDRGSPE